MTDDVIEIEVKPRERKTLKFMLGEEIYEFGVPKLYGLMSAIKGVQSGDVDNAQAFSKVEDWVFGALPAKDAKRLRARLADPDDSLDVEHLVKVFQELTKVAANRPSG